MTLRMLTPLQIPSGGPLVEKDAKVSISDKMSVIKIGPMTLQMKGSGKGSAYHNMQFNMSLNDLTKFMEGK